MATQEEDLTKTETPAAGGEGVDQQSRPEGEQPQQPAADTTTKVAEGAPAAPAADADKEKPKSALEAVLKVMGRKPGEAAPAIGADQKTVKKDEPTEADNKAAGGEEKDWISREEYAKLPPVVRRRITRLTDQRNQGRDELKVTQPKAKTYDDLQAYCTKNGVSQDDFSYGLNIMSLVRTNPAEAWKQLQPLVADLQAYVGEILPTDLAKEVEAGTINEARAKELAATRRERERLAGAHTANAEQARRTEAERTYTDAVTKNTDAVTAWETNWKSSDPDYAKKSEQVWARMTMLLNDATEFGRKMLSPQQTVKIAEKARTDVEAWLGGLMPKPREIKPGPGSNGGSGANVSTVKKAGSALEAARIALSR